MDAQIIGVSLHWMVHTQGALAVAERIKRQRPDTPLIFGGISATIYAQELIRYPFVDMVMRGYDTHAPMADLLAGVKAGGDLGRVPNLLWKSADGQIHDNGMTHQPANYGRAVDWSRQPEGAPSALLPIKELVVAPMAGCAFDCNWCGGSREAFRRIYGGAQAVAHKPAAEIARELASVSRLPDVSRYMMYAIGTYNQSGAALDRFLDHVGELGLRSVNYEQYHLTPDAVLERMARANRRTTITLSPESHDLNVARRAGRGVYTNAEMEAWIERALERGIEQVDIWYFVGMPGQDAAWVRGTVDYCGRLLEKFKGRRVNPLICPMIPFLDPASNIFEDPARYGYRVYHRTLEEHRRAMERASIINTINYETRDLSRSDLVYVGYRAVRDLMELKAGSGQMPRSLTEAYVAKINDALDFIPVVHAADCLTDLRAREDELARLGDEILKRNQMIFYAGVMNQAFPVNRQIGGRWFDELGWDAAALDEMGVKG